jgi:hypothetical protein
VKAVATDSAPETWLDLEKLTARIYAELESGCLVEHDARLEGEESGIRRQIDVLIRSPETGAIVVVDCKDRGRPLDVNDAYQFAGVLADVKATNGILICNRGFSKAAQAVASRRGFNLCQLHDVSSRKWRLDVLIPIVWTRVWVSDLQVGMTAYFEAGDSFWRRRAPDFARLDEPCNPVDEFVAEWNAGRVARRPGSYTWTTRAALLTVEGSRREAEIFVHCSVEGESSLGYVYPEDSRGILEVGTGAYFTTTLDVEKTMAKEPDDGWQPVGNPDELAISIRGSVLTLDDVRGITA